MTKFLLLKMQTVRSSFFLFPFVAILFATTANGAQVIEGNSDIYSNDAGGISDGAEWYGLIKSDRGDVSVIKKVKLKVVPSTTYDGGIAVSSSPEADFLFKDVPGVKEGPVKFSVFKKGTLHLGDYYEYSDSAILYYTGTASLIDGKLRPQTKISGAFIRISGKTHKVVSNPINEIDLRPPGWLGDINNDGFPDFLQTPQSDGDHPAPSELFISVKQGDTFILKKVATLPYQGC